MPRKKATARRRPPKPKVIRDADLERRWLEDTRAELTEARALNGKLAELLMRTADALKGPPDTLKLHDWSDLPRIANALRAPMPEDLTITGLSYGDIKKAEREAVKVFEHLDGDHTPRAAAREAILYMAEALRAVLRKKIAPE